MINPKNQTEEYSKKKKRGEEENKHPLPPPESGTQYPEFPKWIHCSPWKKRCSFRRLGWVLTDGVCDLDIKIREFWLGYVFLQITNNIGWHFLVYKMEYARRNGRPWHSRNLGGTLYITGLVHQNVSPVYGILQPSFDRGWSGEGSYVYSKLVDKYIQVK